MTLQDALIIGAGPAGSIAAILLARAGWHVTIIEQHRFPRDKVCGECLSALGIDVLDRLGLRGSFANKLTELRRTILHPKTRSSIEIELPRPMWGLSRMVFDDALLHAAQDAGATIVQPARCEQMMPRVKLRRLDNNRVTELSASWVLLADGKGALLPRKPRPTGDLGIKAHFESVAGPRDAIELFGVDGHYAGLAPIEGGRWNLAFSVPTPRVAGLNANLDELLEQMTTQNPSLRARLQKAKRVGAWLTTPLPRFSVRQVDWPPHVIPLGNAAAALEPIGGEGMGLAMRSAELAAHELIAACRDDREADVRRLRRQFDRLWRVRQVACRAAAVMISSPRMSRALAPIVDTSPSLQKIAMTLIGK